MVINVLKARKNPAEANCDANKGIINDYKTLKNWGFLEI